MSRLRFGSSRWLASIQQRADVAMIQQAFVDGEASGAITTDANGCSVVPEDFFTKLTAQLNPEPRRSFLTEICDKIEAETKTEDAAFIANIATLRVDDLRAVAANQGTHERYVALRLAAEAELRRRGV